MANKTDKNGNGEIEFILDRFEGSKAVLRYNEQELVLPKRCLGYDVQEGDVLHAEFIGDKMMTKRKENLARAMLEEILKGE